MMFDIVAYCLIHLMDNDNRRVRDAATNMSYYVVDKCPLTFNHVERSSTCAERRIRCRRVVSYYRRELRSRYGMLNFGHTPLHKELIIKKTANTQEYLLNTYIPEGDKLYDVLCIDYTLKELIEQYEILERYYIGNLPPRNK